MARPQRPASNQKELLERAHSAPSFFVARTLWSLVDESESINLEPEWREIWLRNRDEVIRDRQAPPQLVEKIDEAISAILFIDKNIDSLKIGANQKVCLLLGAGASAAAPSSIPTVAALLPELWRRARKLGRDDIERLANWCDERHISNIEDLLTAAYLANFAAKNSNISSLLNYFLFREREMESAVQRRLTRASLTSSQVDAASVALFQETLQGLFGLLTGTMLPALPNSGHAAIADFINAHPNSSIVTTNYDGCIDEALLKAGAAFETHVAEGSPPQSNSLDLIKIHGSINWSYCESCHDVKEFDLLALKEGYEKDTISYAVVGICKNCGGQRRPLLIPPMGLKFIMFPNLIRLWNLARKHIESADYVVVVGFSFSEADSYVNKIIERSMSFNKRQIMVVCDPDHKLVERLQSRYSARIEGFKAERILPALGSSDELLPKVLNKLTAAPASNTSASRGRKSRSS